MSRVLGILALLAILGAGVFIGLSETGVIEADIPLVADSPTSTTRRRATTTSSSSTTTTTGSERSTTTTAAAGAATSSTAAGATTTTTAAVTTTTLAGGSVPDCGRGVARATAGVATVEGTYELTAMVRNEADRAVEIDTLAVRATYPGPRTTIYPTDTSRFAGTQIEPGQQVTFAIRESRAAEAPTSFEMAEFTYHTAGLPQCRSS